MLVLFVAGEATMADVPRPIWLLIKHAVVSVLRLFYKPFYEEYTRPILRLLETKKERNALRFSRQYLCKVCQQEHSCMGVLHQIHC